MLYWILKAILSPLLRVVFRVDVQGADNLPREGPVILASNHQSFIDSIFIPLVSPRRVTFVAKAEYFDNVRTAWFFRAMGQIPIQRGGGSSADRALASARQVLTSGGVLGIYPEGTRSPDGRLYKGHTGVARLALQCGAVVVPVAVGGTAAVQPIGSVWLRPFRAVSVQMGEPLAWPELQGQVEDPVVLRRVTDEVVDAIAALSGQEQVREYCRRVPVGPAVAGAPGPTGGASAPSRPGHTGVSGATGGAG